MLGAVDVPTFVGPGLAAAVRPPAIARFRLCGFGQRASWHELLAAFTRWRICAREDLPGNGISAVPPPTMREDREINEQDCTTPVVNFTANLKCR